MHPARVRCPSDKEIDRSPVVSNGRITFSLRAPDAKAVTVSGDFGPDASLTRGADGVWSATVGSVTPEDYVYYFIVDGVRLRGAGSVRASALNVLDQHRGRQPARVLLANDVALEKLKRRLFRSLPVSDALKCVDVPADDLREFVGVRRRLERPRSLAAVRSGLPEPLRDVSPRCRLPTGTRTSWTRYARWPARI